MQEKPLMRLAFRGVPWLCAAICLAPAASLAEPNQKAEALRHYDLGLSHMRSKAYGEAIAELNQAYDLGHDFAVLYDVGLVYTAMDEPVHAIQTLKRYLSEGGRRIASARRKDTEAEIARLEGRIATVVIHAKLDGIVIRVDGIEAGKTPLPDGLRINAGSHLLAASAAGHRAWEQRLALAGGDRRNLDVDLEPGESPAVAAAPAMPPPTVPASAGLAEPAQPSVAGTATTQAPAPAPTSFPTRKVAAYALGGLGVGALVIGGVYGVEAISKRQDSDSHCPQNQCSQAGVDLNNQAKSAAWVADIAIGAGLVSVAVATYLLLRAPKGETSPPATSAQGTRLLAEVGPGKAGLALRGSW